MNRIFVYGTLLSGQYNNHRYLQNDESKLMGDARTTAFEMYSLGAYPACIESEFDANEIIGEIWEVSDLVLEKLDRLEGYPRFYNRKKIETTMGESWIYYMSREDMENKLFKEFIPSGSWLEYIGREN